MDLPFSIDGHVSFEMLPRQKSVCERIQGTYLPDGSEVGGYGDLGYGRTGKGGRGHGRGQSVSWGEVQSYRHGVGVAVPERNEVTDRGLGQGCCGPPPSHPVVVCSITWAIYIEGDNNLLLLVETEHNTAKKTFLVVSFNLGNWGTTGGEFECTTDNGREMLLTSLLGKG